MLTSSMKDSLRKAALEVHAAAPAKLMNARTAARFLSGVARFIATEWDVPTMQRAFVELWRCRQVGHPAPSGGNIAKPVSMLGVIVTGLVPMTDHAALMAALAFWAVESDPAEWLKLDLS